MTSPISLELQSKITEWRRRAALGELTLDEQKEAIRHLRADRLAAGQAAARSRATGKTRVAPSADAAQGILDELDSI